MSSCPCVSHRALLIEICPQQVDALSARSPPVSALAAPFHSNLSLTRPPSAALAANRALAGGGIETSAPPSPILTGTDNFPVGPVANGPTSPILNGDDELHGLPSPRTGGGVDAFKAKRASSFSTSPTAGTHTPHGTLAAAYTIKGMPAPGQVTPPRKDAKEALYPSRVVLTSTSYSPFAALRELIVVQHTPIKRVSIRSQSHGVQAVSAIARGRDLVTG